MNDAEASFLDEVVAFVQGVSSSLVHDLAAALLHAEECGRAIDEPLAAELASHFAQADVRASVADLLESRRSKCRRMTPGALAWALRAACRTEALNRLRQSIELVWTGPAPTGSTLRRTDQALLDLIRGAERSIVVVTFAAYKVPEITIALEHAVARGVAVAFIGESDDESEGRLTFDASEALGETLARQVLLYLWPLCKRTRDNKGRHGTLHVKCAVADDDHLLVSSANLTEYALNLNMELGVSIRGGELPAKIGDHIRRLIADGVLVPVEARR